jgi:hypothetical protein
MTDGQGCLVIVLLALILVVLMTACTPPKPPSALAQEDWNKHVFDGSSCHKPFIGSYKECLIYADETVSCC